MPRLYGNVVVVGEQATKALLPHTRGYAITCNGRRSSLHLRHRRNAFAGEPATQVELRQSNKSGGEDRTRDLPGLSPNDLATEVTRVFTTGKNLRWNFVTFLHPFQISF